MYKLEFRTNYNVVLFNFIDSLSKWDSFVGDHIGRYFEGNYRLNHDDKLKLEKYSKLRRKLSWRKEIELFNWAYAGFPKNENFSQLEELLHHFEDSINLKGKTLRSELEDATAKLRFTLDLCERSFHELKIEEVIKQFVILFESPDHDGSLPCYLTFSPHRDNIQGGANGVGIYTQVPTDLESDTQVSKAVSVIVHEYMHMEINPGRLFRDHSDAAKRKIYNEKYPEIYPDDYYQFIEEVIVYTLNDVITFKVDPEEVRNYYDTKYKGDGIKKQRSIALWQGVCDVREILEDYLDGGKDRRETLQAMDRYFLGRVG